MNVIEASGLTKRFGSTQALAGVDLTAEQSSRVPSCARTIREPGLFSQAPAGYRLRVQPGDVDDFFFVELVARAERCRVAGDLEGGVSTIDAYLERTQQS